MAKGKSDAATAGATAAITGSAFEVGRNVVTNLIATAGKQITDQFTEGAGGIGPKDEGNFSAVINAWTSAKKDDALVFPGGVENCKKWEHRVMTMLTPAQLRWFIRVIANMLADELTARPDKDKNVTEAAIVVAKVLDGLITNYPITDDDNEQEKKQWVDALYARRLIRVDRIDRVRTRIRMARNSYKSLAERFRQERLGNP